MSSIRDGQFRDPTCEEVQTIQQVLIHYATALDTKNWDLLRACFREDATAKYGDAELLEGREKIVAFIARALDRFVATQHLIGNFQIRVMEGRARTRTALQATHLIAGDDGGILHVVVGDYFDELVRDDQGWRFVERREVNQWSERRPLGMPLPQKS